MNRRPAEGNTHRERDHRMKIKGEADTTITSIEASRGNQRITGWVCDHVIDVFRSVRITDDTPSHIVRRVIEKGKQMIIDTDSNQAAEEIRLGRVA